MEWIIGRKEGEIRVNNGSVSGKHAKLTKLIDGTYRIEDLNSTNGTTVNGVRIISKTISASDIVALGGVIVDLSQCFSNLPKQKEVAQNPNDLQTRPTINLDYSEQFEKKKFVYDQYNRKKVKIQSETASKVMMMRSLPMIVPAMLSLAVLIMGESGSEFKTTIAIIGGLLSIIGLVWGIQASAKAQSKIPEMLLELEDDFKVEYICPRCKVFLGNLPWKNLRNRGECSNPQCRAKFVKS